MPKVTVTDKKGLVQSSGGGMTVSSPFTLSTSDIAVAGTTYGAGAIGTGTIGAPELRRWTKDGVIMTQIRVDLTGLGVQGSVADEAIGLAAGGAAYIYKNVVADNGIIFKYTVQMVELGALGAGVAITNNINLVWNTSATIEYDGDCGDTISLKPGVLKAGQTGYQDTAAVTADFYLYMTTADNGANNGTYSAGQLVITLYGHALLT